MDDSYSIDRCEYCLETTWCEIRANGRHQCRACQVERFFEHVLYPALGYRLQAWQRKVLRDLYGTLKENGLRQYRKAYVSVAKQNGKSFLLGGLPLYHLIIEDERNPEAYGVASAKDQAGIVFNAAAAFVKASPALSTRLKVLESTKRIIRRDGGGIYAVLAADGDVQDGKRPSLLLFDELHRFMKAKAKSVRTVLTKGMISRSPVINGIETGEPLMIQTTTSGDEYECPLWADEYDYASRVRDGGIDDPSYYTAIWQADPRRIETEPEYWKSREARAAANPSHEDHGGFLADSIIEEEMTNAVRRPETKGDFIRLNLNVPVIATGTPAVEMPNWNAGHGEGLDMRDWPTYDVDLAISKWSLAGRTCVAGIDLAWSTDMAAVVLLFPPFDQDVAWKVLTFCWLPGDKEILAKIEERTHTPLQRWIDRGFLNTCEGSEISLQDVFDRVLWANKMFDVKEVCLDPWGGAKAAAELLLVPKGFTCTKIAQTFAGLSEATKRFIALYTGRQLWHGNNPIMNWHASCLALKTDGGDNAKPIKPPRDKSSKRIDSIAATITALARAITLKAPNRKPVVRYM